MDTTYKVGDHVCVWLEVLEVTTEDVSVPGHEPLYQAAGSIRVGFPDPEPIGGSMFVAPWCIRPAAFAPTEEVRSALQRVFKALRHPWDGMAGSDLAMIEDWLGKTTEVEPTACPECDRFDGAHDAACMA